ncbi:20s proteasome maturation protein [Ophiostoma piceae UAMH 11346]|uniref:20s proteasome maturation protein n=1 Tax=Ophiostoma piceae (strain UAMH 11346) TaxID=1262450 RepID=S3CVL7_OPHP1|nr:20s proteasome maturation protein [Ophiostoma piceae UAMH 11346]
MSLRLVPTDPHSASYSHIASREKGAPSAPGVHDVLRSGVGPKVHAAAGGSAQSSTTVPALDSAHPLEARLKQWEATREALRMETLRRSFGIAEPVRRGMELKITREGEWRPLALGGSGASSSQMPSVHEDILLGRDTTVDWEDVYTGEETRSVPTFHEEMERKLRM